ncbi:MAG: hypothetical protein CVU65_13590 [Deltaproteobacteria bacterium HGW-Deltaproteobacteria-22]|jgi:uncharacterized protein YceK|nr:MAG: hypothetical protein CVU65_13590 [Deltaproteobacteria bacterium HGW-Deltaproteobacteria-22]
MKKFALMLIVGLFALGCGSHARKDGGTCPHKAKHRNLQEQSDMKDKPAGQDKNAEDFDADDGTTPAVSGYGSDPGEDTQE